MEARAEAARQQALQMADAKGANRLYKRELEALKEEYSATIAYWREQERRWDTSRAEMAHGAEEDLAMERAARVAQVGQQIVRRILSRDLSMAFTSWVEMVDAKQHAMDRLRQAANRLRGRAPDVADAFRFWVAEVEEAKRAFEVARREEDVTSLYRKLHESEEEVQRLQAREREQLSPTHKFSKGQRIKRMEETKRSKAIVTAGKVAAEGTGSS